MKDTIDTQKVLTNVLTAASYDFFQQHGFLIFEDYITPEEIETLKNRALYYVQQFDPHKHRHVFKPGPNNDQYFLESGDKIRWFLEEHALLEGDKLNCSSLYAINKLGHALHELDPTYRKFSYSDKIKEVIHWLGIKKPCIAQSMYLFKQPKIGDEVPWHQDATFIRTQPSSVIGLWIALDDANVENGCLWVIPGGHNLPLKQIYSRNGDEVEMKILDDSPWPTLHKQPICVKAGSMVLLHGNLPHMSMANQSSIARHAYSLHIVDLANQYCPDNWLQKEMVPFAV